MKETLNEHKNGVIHREVVLRVGVECNHCGRAVDRYVSFIKDGYANGVSRETALQRVGFQVGAHVGECQMCGHHMAVSLEEKERLVAILKK